MNDLARLLARDEYRGATIRQDVADCVVPRHGDDTVGGDGASGTGGGAGAGGVVGGGVVTGGRSAEGTDGDAGAAGGSDA